MRLAVFLLTVAPVFAQAPVPGPDITKFEPGLYALINTSVGTITAQLFEKEAADTVNNFTALATGRKPWLDPKTKKPVLRPLYANLIFHRVIPQFMIQTGDPTETGAHNCGVFVKDDFQNGFKFDKPGRLGMANSGTPNSGGCQFFITETTYPAGNGKYTIFGQVVDGQPLVAKIAHVITDDKDKPRVPTKLLSVKLLRIVPRAEPPKAEPPKAEPSSN